VLIAGVVFSTEVPEHMLKFSGKDLDGWKMAGAGRFVFEKGMLRTAGAPCLLYFSFPQYSGPGYLHVEFQETRASDEAWVSIKMQEPSASSAGSLSGYRVRIAPSGDQWH
jgi:hypothetical protein